MCPLGATQHIIREKYTYRDNAAQTFFTLVHTHTRTHRSHRSTNFHAPHKTRHYGKKVNVRGLNVYQTCYEVHVPLKHSKFRHVLMSPELLRDRYNRICMHINSKTVTVIYKKLLWNTYACETSYEKSISHGFRSVTLLQVVQKVDIHFRFAISLPSWKNAQTLYSVGQSVHEVSRQTVRLRTSFLVCDVVIRPQIAIMPIHGKSATYPKRLTIYDTNVS
jgi:hypothetical protein